jgi:DNA-binding MarR family transcriptional regulator
MPRRRDSSRDDDGHTANTVEALRRIIHALRTSAGLAVARVGVTGAQLFVLQILAESPALSLNELAQRTLTHQSTVSVVVNRLARRGLVTKRRSEDDGRRVELRLSPEGKALVRRSPQVAQGRLIEGLHALPVREGRELARLLRRLVAAMGAAREPAAMFFADTDDGGYRKGP